MNPPGSIAIDPLAGSPLACGSVVFRHRAQLRVTVIAKATFALVHDGTMTLAPPAALRVEDAYLHKTPTGSLQAGSDLVPHRPRVDVTFVGHACAVGRAAPATVARLAVFRERARIDKFLHVYGDRAHAGHEGGIVPTPDAVRPFDRMPLIYERAYAMLDDPSSTENPVGTAEPNLVDPRDPKKPACFGPISPSWPNRRRLLATVDRHAFEASVAEIPDGFDWRYFQAAPLDQQLDVLHGDEWIVLDGLHPTLPRVQTRLPSAVAAARVHVGSASRPGGEPLTLVADTLAIDGDRQTCEVVWRGSFPVAGGEAALATLRILVGLEVPGRPLASPTRMGAPASQPPASAGDESPEAITSVKGVEDNAGTLLLSDPRVPAMAPATPFRGKGAVPSVMAAHAAPAGGVARAPSRSMKTLAVEEDLEFVPVMPFVVPLATMPGSDDVVGVTPFPLAQPGARRSSVPPPEIAGAPWAAAAAARAPAIRDPLAGTLVASSPPELRAEAWKELGAAPPPPPLTIPPAPAVPPEMIGPLATLEMAHRQASPAPEDAEPTAPIAPPLTPIAPAHEALPLEAFPIERCAATAASMARRTSDRAQILEENELTQKTWDALMKHWTAEIRKETRQGKTALLEVYDHAYVARLEEERGPIQVEEYAQLTVAGERGDAEAALVKLTLPPGAMLRLQRVWMGKMAASAPLRASVRRATEAARNA